MNATSTPTVIAPRRDLMTAVEQDERGGHGTEELHGGEVHAGQYDGVHVRPTVALVDGGEHAVGRWSHG